MTLECLVSCLQLKMKKHYIKTSKISREHVGIIRAQKAFIWFTRYNGGKLTHFHVVFSQDSSLSSSKTLRLLCLQRLVEGCGFCLKENLAFREGRVFGVGANTGDLLAISALKLNTFPRDWGIEAPRHPNWDPRPHWNAPNITALVWYWG